MAAIAGCAQADDARATAARRSSARLDGWVTESTRTQPFFCRQLLLTDHTQVLTFDSASADNGFEFGNVSKNFFHTFGNVSNLK
jgi:hypothetical protein